MGSLDTGRAIGAVSELVRTHLEARIAPPDTTNVTIGRPDQTGSANPRVNLFLFEASFDASMRSLSIQEGRPAPLWLTLRYLLTAHDSNGESTTSVALRLIGDLHNRFAALAPICFGTEMTRPCYHRATFLLIGQRSTRLAGMLG